MRHDEGLLIHRCNRRAVVIKISATPMKVRANQIIIRIDIFLISLIGLHPLLVQVPNKANRHKHQPE